MKLSSVFSCQISPELNVLIKNRKFVLRLNFSQAFESRKSRNITGGILESEELPYNGKTFS